MHTETFFPSFPAAESAEPTRPSDSVESYEEGFRLLEGTAGDASAAVFCGNPTSLLPEERRRLIRLLARLCGDSLRRAGFGERDEPLLVCGLGNDSLTPDSLGPRTVRRLFLPPELTDSLGLPKVFSFTPGTSEQTGLSTARLVRCVAQEVNAGAVLAVDALCARKRERLGTVIQLTDGGIVPGSGSGGGDEELSAATLSRPVLSVGIPTVIRAETLCGGRAGRMGEDRNGDSLLYVAPASCDLLTERGSSLLAEAIGSAVLSFAREISR